MQHASLGTALPIGSCSSPRSCPSRSYRSRFCHSSPTCRGRCGRVDPDRRNPGIVHLALKSLLKNSKNRSLTLAAPNRDGLFAETYGAATVRERGLGEFFNKLLKIFFELCEC